MIRPALGPMIRSTSSTRVSRFAWCPPTTSEAAGRNQRSSIFALAVLFGKPLDGHHTLAILGREHDHSLRAAAGDPDAVDRAADKLTAVSDQHDLIAFLDREGGDDAADLLLDSAVLFVDIHRDHAFAAALCGPVLVGRRALTIALLGNCQHQLLGCRQLDV